MTPNEISEASACFACIEDKAAARLYLLGRIAAITDPTVIASNAAGFDLPISDQVLALVLLAQMAGVTDLGEIVSGSACYSGLNERAAALYLAEAIASNGSSPSSDCGLVWAPDQTLLEFLTLGDVIGGATSLTFPLLQSVGVGFGGSVGVTNTNLEELHFPVLSICEGNFFCTSNAVLSTLEAGLLVSVNAGLSVASNPNLVSLDLHSLSTVVVDDADFSDCPSLVTLNLPALTQLGSFGGNFFASNSSALVNVSFPLYIPADGKTLQFSGCSLSQVSVDHILARCVANPAYVSGTVDLSGGASSAPGVQGALDVITLTGRGVTVNTN